MNGRPLRVFIASHACAAPTNQSLFKMAAASRGWDVTLCLPSGWRDEYGRMLRAELLAGFDATLVSLPVLCNGSVPLHAYRGRLTQILREVNPDVVYAHNEAYAVSTWQWCRANSRSVRRPFGFFSCQNLSKRYPPPFAQAERSVYRKSRFFFPITKAVEEVHRGKGYAGPATIVPLGFDPAMFRPTRDITKRHLESSNRPVRIGYVGRVVEEKGLVTLAKALGRLKERSWELLIAGSGPYELQVRAALEQAGVADRVQWPGFVARDQMAAFYESVDVIVLPSETRSNWKEQFGRVILESLACGTPVLGSDSGEIPVLIKATGGGEIFHETDAASCATALSRLLVDPRLRATVGESACAIVHEKYALPWLADKFANAMESAAATSPDRGGCAE